MKRYIECEKAVIVISEWLMKALHSENMSSYNEGERAAYRTALNEILNLPAADVRPVVTCGECKWWTKQEASLQGRCELLQIYPTGAWFCANGKREES